MDRPIRIIIADDHHSIRLGFRRMIERAEGIEVVGEAADGMEVFRLLNQVEADLLLLDVHMSPVGGIEVIQTLHRENHPIRVVGISSYSNRQFIFEMLAHGASGYLSKEDSSELIIDTLRRAIDGQRCLISPGLRLQLHESLTPYQAPDPKGEEALHRAVMRLLAQGYRNDEIAKKLNLSENEVHTIEAKLSTNLGTSTRTGLVAWVWQKGLMSV